MSHTIERWPAPVDAVAFETFCFDLWSDIWGADSQAKMHGRKGQVQAGVDVYGKSGGQWVGVQCKQKDGRLWSIVKESELEEEVEAAKDFRPHLGRFILATSAVRDTRIQRKARELSDANSRAGLFTVEIWAWEDIWDEMTRRPALQSRLGQRYWPGLMEAARQGPDSSTLLRPYLQHIMEQCRFVPLRAVQREQRHERGDPQRAQAQEDPDQRLELERIFVELDTTTQVKVQKGEPEGTPVEDMSLPGLEPGDREAKMRYVPALEAIARASGRHVVLHGAPGCGKSTLVRFLMLAQANCLLGMADQWLPLLPGWSAAEADLLPVRVELRHFGVWLQETGRSTALPCHLHDYLVEHLGGLARDNTWADLVPAVDSAARRGKALFLLDGLDEVPGAEGKFLVRNCLDAFADSEFAKACRIVVTCRTRSYEAEYKQGRRLHLFQSRSKRGGAWPSAFEIRPLDTAKTTRFVTTWYDALGEADPASAADCKARAHALRQILADPKNRKLAEMAGNPLLLTVICHLHSSQRDLRLPDNRAELFHDLIDLLLTRWAERHRGQAGAKDRPEPLESLGELLQDPGLHGFEEAHFLQLVAELAHDHYRGGSDRTLIVIPEDTLRRRLAEQHQDLDTSKGAAWAERVMNFIQYRAGLLNSPDGLNYDFPHSLLGEYLAACHLTRVRDSNQAVVAKVGEDGNWDEVVRLVAGHYAFVEKDTGKALFLVEDLCEAAESKCEAAANITPREWRRVALAGDILHEIGPARLDRERRQGATCRELLRKLLVVLLERGALPVRDRARAGQVLGHLGDPRKGVGARNELPDIDWIEIPPGSFLFGDPPKPCGVITTPYQISRYPVTVAQFESFARAGGYDQERLWTRTGWAWKNANTIKAPEAYAPVFQTPNHPRVGVSWHEAFAFCRWLSERTGNKITLPSEFEWERAARHVDGRNYPWVDGQANVGELCNVGETGLGHTSAVGLFPGGNAVCGAADMAGNVWEWCRSLGEEKVVLDREPGMEGRAARVVRGGAWYFRHVNARCSFRLRVAPDDRFRSVGFRVVASPFVSAP